uniref:Uncharacterized protein n=1 Tax=Magallana gigas TaxID=29159 RepID=A0A8W8NAK6_MAGGI
MSNFSANHLFLKWNPPDGNTTLNHYRVVINGDQQQTFGSVSEIYWNKKLTPGTIYNVTIVAVSYGDLLSGLWNGLAESESFVDWIETDTGNEEGYSYLPFGERDEVLRGDDVTSAVLKSPTTVYAGDSSQGGFTFVQIGSNGVIGLGEEFNSITIHDIGTDTLKGRRIICPFWVDLLTVDSMGNIYYPTYQRGIDAENDLYLRKANTIVRVQFADFPEFEASWIVKVTWENMTVFGDKSKTVTFQCLLITDGQSTFTVFNYIDVDLNPLKDKKIAIGYQYGTNFERNSLSNKDMAFRMSDIPGNRAINFGDPHIVTLDGLNYTFNGYGEYTMLNISKNTIQFDFQARTDLATTANDTTINATIFSAFVAQDQTGSNLQIEMSRDKTRMLVRVNGRDLTREFENSSYVYLKQNLSVRWENNTLAASFLQTSIIVKVSLGVRFLISEVVVDSEYGGHAKGLMGNFDGNPTNDFILPNGTILNKNLTKTERNVYNNFGQQYAKTKCGPNPSQACIFDYLATGDIALAESSGTEEASAQCDKQIVENETPSIAGNTSINVEVGMPVYMQFKASDDSDKKPLFKILKQPPGFTLNETIGMATWIPNNTDVSEISISVIDDIGAESPSLDVSIVLCGGCNDLGRCDYNNIIPSENALYNLAACVCNVGYSGENCELDTDACLNEPCPLLRNCTDLTPDEEVRFGRGFNCTDCPLGYKDIENKCEDINECENNSAVSCNSQSETCENTDGSYFCICLPGFRKENSTCKDIDECLEKTSGCQQICKNTDGSFKCQCFKGFSLNSDNTTCFRTDFNECDAKPCQQNCTNTDGSFQCTCSAGYQLKIDKISCSECEEPNFGENCSQVCTCGQGMDKCDPVTGCVCKPGWIGVNCTEDVDECDNKTICGNERVCHYLEGSYQCKCKDGFSMDNGVCEDVNECESGTADCEHICINTIGGYNCDCEFGFALHDKDRRTCQKVSNVCDSFPKLNCSYGCWFEKNGNSYEGYCFCESDIDECTESNRCQQNCTNFDGSFKCVCTTGYTLENDGISCKGNGEFKVKIEIHFYFGYDREEVLNKSKEWRNEIQSKLKIFYEKHIKDITRVVVLSLRFGSIIVDHEIFANGSQQSLKLNVTNSMIKILQQRENISLFNHSTTVKNVDVYGNGSKTSYDNSDYWKSINDLLNRQEQFRIKRPTTRIN